MAGLAVSGRRKRKRKVTKMKKKAEKCHRPCVEKFANDSSGGKGFEGDAEC